MEPGKIDTIQKRLRQSNMPHSKSLLSTIRNGTEALVRQRKLLKVRGRLVSIPEKGEAVIIGDLHGDYKSLNQIIKDSGTVDKLKNPDQYLICLGDYIDRGPSQTNVLYRLLKLLEKYPEQVILLQGNHETRSNTQKHHFSKTRSYLEQIYKQYNQQEAMEIIEHSYTLFNNLYLGCVIENQALLVHGGIPVEADSLDDIAYADTLTKQPENTYHTQILWNDPWTLMGAQPSSRGIGNHFGVDIASQFLSETGLNTIIRGHESYDEGYFFHDDKVITLFSCKLPVYRNSYLAYQSIPLDIEFTRNNLEKHIRQLPK